MKIIGKLSQVMDLVPIKDRVKADRAHAASTPSREASRRTRHLAELQQRATEMARAPSRPTVNLESDIRDARVLQAVADDLMADAELLSAVLGEAG